MDKLLRRVKRKGFDSLEAFVEANLHYLPKPRQELFYSLVKNQRPYAGKYEGQEGGGPAYGKG